jgi:hypothetical protein
MPIPTSGAISLSGIQTEFGGSNPIGLNEYYRGGANVGSNPTTLNMTAQGYAAPTAGGVPTSGAISFNNFFGTTKRYSITRTVTATTSNYNLYNNIPGIALMTSPLDITLVINSGVTLFASSTAFSGLTIGSSYPAGTKIYIQNNGSIWGAGGAGGRGGSTTGSCTPGTVGLPGGAGSNAITQNWSDGTSSSVTISNFGTIAGGGGGGGGGGSIQFDGPYTTDAGGGGGGQGYVGGAGGAKGCSFFFSAWPYYLAQAGSAGNVNGAGAGGAGGMLNYYYAPGGGNGGSAGNAGAAGGSSTYAGGAGGAKGFAVKNTVAGSTTIAVTGTLLGGVG